MNHFSGICVPLFISVVFYFFGRVARAQNVTSREAVSSVQLSEDESSFFLCPPAVGTTVVRLEPPRKCPEPLKAIEWGEGIAILFKENINPYKFKVTLYYKNVIQTTTWTGTTYRQITNRFTDRTPVSIEEITDVIDAKGRCSSKARYLRNNVYVEAYDGDAGEKQVLLQPSKFNTPESKAWHTTNDTYTVWGSPWVYRTGTSVNCIVEEMDARAAFPYSYFAMANGDIANMSPFYGVAPPEAAAEPMGYPLEQFRQIDGYFPMDLSKRQKASIPVKRNFLVTPHFTVGWDWAAKTARVCSMVKWKDVTEMLRATVNGKYRFMARELSSTFISNTTEFDPDRIRLGQCVKRDAETTIKRIFAQKYNDSHVKVGKVQYFLALGGFLVAYQPVMSKSLAHMYLRELMRDNRTDELLDLVHNKHALSNKTNVSLSRLRRELRNAPKEKLALNEGATIRSTSSVQFAMLQFLYDHIQTHINDMFSRIATAWCELQNKELALWQEGMKINPSAIASATLGRRVAAKMLGDVTAVSTCTGIDAESVTLQNSMRVATSTNMCYSRPLVLFSYGENQGRIQGQLGENNELLPTLEAVEPCTANQRRYFLFGSAYALFEDYNFVKMVEVADIQTASTFVDLNLTLLEDREILPLSVYTKEELRDVGVLDYAEVARRNQLHELKFYDINKVIEVDTNYAFMNGLAELFNGMGQVGQAIGKVVVGAAGAVVATVSGVSAFMSNPFGALAVGLIIIAGLVAAFLAYWYVNKLRGNPMKALYPVTTEELKSQATRELHGEEPDSEKAPIDKKKLQKAREMIKYMALVSAEERHENDLRKKTRGTTAILSNHLTKLRLKSSGQHYDRLSPVYSDSEDDAV